MRIKIFKNMMLLCIITMMFSCSHKTTDKLVGNDRDSHGCIASAGYVWSEAVKDCIRVWEVCERIDNGEKKVYVLFSDDKSLAEVFMDGGKTMLCKKVNDNLWESKKSKVSVSLQQGILKVHADKTDFSKSVR